MPGHRASNGYAGAGASLRRLPDARQHHRGERLRGDRGGAVGRVARANAARQPDDRMRAHSSRSSERVVTGHDGTLASLKQLYREAGVLAATDPLPAELARTLDEAEEITGLNMWE